MTSISVVIPVSFQDPNFDLASFLSMKEFLIAQSHVSRIIFACESQDQSAVHSVTKGTTKVRVVEVDSWISSATMMRLLEEDDNDGILLCVGVPHLGFEPQSIKKIIEIADICDAGLVYSDYRKILESKIVDMPTLNYQEGSIRDTFDFGPLVLISRRAAFEVLQKHGPLPKGLRWSGFYDLRLKLSMNNSFIRIAEPLFTTKATQAIRSRSRNGDLGETFYAADFHNRRYLEEVESIATAHLRRVGSYVESGSSCPISASEIDYPVTASVIMPTHNREETLGSALESALNQVVSFSYNIIVVDDHSTDRSLEIIQHFCREYDNIVHLIPQRRDLGIGGLWNEAIYSPQCGLYAIQLDSDDVYSHDRAIETLVDEFSRTCPGISSAERASPRYAMVLGSFVSVDADLAEISPGVDETPQLSLDNLRNNLLCVEGPSAPRAFFVPVLRQFGFPNVSFGEDYAIALRIAREYEVGRVFEPSYLARHWRGNTTRTLPFGSLKSTNMNGLVPPSVTKREFWSRLEPITGPLAIASSLQCSSYKDYLRTVEIRARRRLNKR